MKAILLAGFMLMALLSDAIAQTPAYRKCCGTKSTQFPFKAITARKTQLWYNAGDFTPAVVSGNITRIYFVSQTGGQSGTFDDLTVSFKQPAAANTGFTGTTFETGMTQVYYSPSVTINGAATAGGWYSITLTTPFAYDHTRPLVVEVTYTNPTAIPGGGLDNWGTDATVPPNKKLYAATLTATTGTTSNGFWQDFGFDVSTANPACTIPGGLNATTITSKTATVSWTAVAASAGYEYAVDLNAAAPGAGTATIATSVPVSGLTPNTTYILHVRNKCVDNTFSAWADYKFNTLPPCHPPVGYSATKITTSSAYISWKAWPTAASYDYYVDKVKTAPVTPFNTTNTFAPISGLAENTWYYVYVRSNCTGNEQSDWYVDSFLTPEKCNAPEIKIDHINTNEAVAYWEPVKTAAGYEYAITKSATPPALGTKYNFTTIHTSALQDGVDYYVHVRTLCESAGVSSSSEWATASFKTFPTSIAYDGGQAALRLYPNPVAQQLNIEVTGGGNEMKTLLLTDMYGKVLREITLKEKRTAVDVANLPKGVYRLKYSDGANTQTFKVDKL
jgi:hypothetical protein